MNLCFFLYDLAVLLPCFSKKKPATVTNRHPVCVCVGVSLIMLSPVVTQFQFPAGAAQVGAGAAIADAALLYLFSPAGN